MTELTEWANFYVVVGSAAGALIGLQFVVLTLIAQRPRRPQAEAGQAFSTPTVLHFCTVLLLSALAEAPWRLITKPAIAWLLIGLLGAIYALIVMKRIAFTDDLPANLGRLGVISDHAVGRLRDTYRFRGFLI